MNYAILHGHHSRTDTRVTWGLNLGQRNLTATFLEARALLKAFSLPNITVVLEAIEIGNEADLYANNGMRTQGYDEVAYVKECVHRELALQKYQTFFPH